MSKLLFFALLCLLPGINTAQVPILKSPYETTDDGSFESLLIRRIGQYAAKINARDPIPARERDSVRRELSLLRQSLTSYYVLTGRFPSHLLTPALLDDTSRLKIPAQTLPLPAQSPLTALGLTPLKTGWVFYRPGRCQSQGDTCRTFAFSPDSSLIALGTATRLTLRQTRTGCPVGTPLTGLSSPVYQFSRQPADLYVVDQRNPAELKRIEQSGRVALISLPDSLARLGYRIDQIRPDDSLIVARRLTGTRTIITALRFGRLAHRFTVTVPQPISQCRLEISAGVSLLAAYRADMQAYMLYTIAPAGPPVVLFAQPISDYQLDSRATLVTLRADSTLTISRLNEPTPTSRTIAAHARYFDWRGDTLVYWQQRSATSPGQWALYTCQLTGLDNGSQRPAGFWYDLGLRRDVPRVSLRGSSVYYVDPFNKTTNRVALGR